MRIILLSISLLFIATSCDRGKNTTGWDYFPDMYYSNAYESFAENPNFENKSSFRQPVANTIPRGMVPFQYDRTPEEMVRAGKELNYTIPVNKDNIARGKEKFEIFCINCHGAKGDGQGFLYTSGKYPFPPASLINEKMIDKPVGEFYHEITLGYGIMQEHGSIVATDDRWRIIMYIKNELQK